ncbi:hypothetical protein DAPPUDRAFT_109559 [Daphnia pulex]|uniref:THAP-type domain-containing protein n=1 Tax=Daphnia pulex TaxID=6669 RepID=E9H3G0_DAPPU|nr:hypothetical protein DAPPUDRAFT_109559 [Daphnia pulex]|eukprot:EFX73762.1 hypothetical protein DAPPUDRAFT_109559 [Daphnia pulex]
MTLMDAGCQDVLDKWKPRSFCTVMQVISLCLSIAIDGHVSQLRLGFSFCSNSMQSKCSAKNCNSKSGDRGVSLLRFPVDDVRRALWLQHCPHNFVPKDGDSQLESTVMCRKKIVYDTNENSDGDGYDAECAETQNKKKRSPEVTVEAVHHETVEIQQEELLKDTVYFEDE